MADATKLTQRNKSSRRDFLRRAAATATGTALAAGLDTARVAHAAGSDTIRIALVGCGGRGTGAAVEALNTGSNVKLVALADVFDDQVERTRAILLKASKKVDLPKERCFVGFDAYRKAIDCGVDVVLICTPPGFKPIQFEAAVDAGKHVFMEKPVAVDAPGVRKVLAAGEKAKKKNLAVAVGLHTRHRSEYLGAIEKIHAGAIGDVMYMRAYTIFSGGGVRPRKPEQTEMQFQMRNWWGYNWISGDHIVEQNVHSVDVINWVKKAHPVTAQGMGGRLVRVGPNAGEIYDHHAVEFEYPDGSRCYNFVRQMPNCWTSYSHHVHGTLGDANMIGYGKCVVRRKGAKPEVFRDGPNAYQVEHDLLFAAVRDKRAYSEADYGAISSMTAIMARMASYSGKIVKWDDAFNSELDMAPDEIAWDTKPPVLPDANGLYACAMPGAGKYW